MIIPSKLTSILTTEEDLAEANGRDAVARRTEVVVGAAEKWDVAVGAGLIGDVVDSKEEAGVAEETEVEEEASMIAVAVVAVIFNEGDEEGRFEEVTF